MIESHAKEHARNRNAHGRLHREQIGQRDTGEAEDMGNTILGDVTHPTPIVVTGNQSGPGLMTGLAIAALGAAVPGAGVLGYMASQMSKAPTPVVQPVETGDIPDFSVGLGKIEDYLESNP